MEAFKVSYINTYGKTMINTHFHDSYEIFFLIDGKRDFFIHNQTYTLHSKSIAFINPKVIHKTIIRESAFVERYVIMIPKEFIQSHALNFEGNIFDCFQKESPLLVLDEKEYSHILNLFEQIYFEYESIHEHSPFILSILTTELLFYLNRYKSARLNSETSSRENTISTQAIDILSSTFEEPITLENLSNQLFISTYQLCRVFKHDTGFTIIEYLTQLRLHRAMVLLDTTTQTVTDIGFTVGFNNTNHFIRTFRQKIGVTPKQYQLRRR